MMVSDVSSYSDTPASVPSTLASKRESVGLSTTVTLTLPTVPEGLAVRGQGRPLTSSCCVVPSVVHRFLTSDIQGHLGDPSNQMRRRLGTGMCLYFGLTS